jgi:hypothetical protein
MWFRKSANNDPDDNAYDLGALNEQIEADARASKEREDRIGRSFDKNFQTPNSSTKRKWNRLLPRALNGAIMAAFWMRNQILEHSDSGRHPLCNEYVFDCLNDIVLFAKFSDKAMENYGDHVAHLYRVKDHEYAEFILKDYAEEAENEVIQSVVNMLNNLKALEKVCMKYEHNDLASQITTECQRVQDLLSMGLEYGIGPDDDI